MLWSERSSYLHRMVTNHMARTGAPGELSLVEELNGFIEYLMCERELQEKISNSRRRTRENGIGNVSEGETGQSIGNRGSTQETQTGVDPGMLIVPTHSPDDREH